MDVRYPLVKSKFGVYDSGYVIPARRASDASKLQDLRPARVRWEMMMGNEQPGWSSMVTGTVATPVYNFTRTRSSASSNRRTVRLSSTSPIRRIHSTRSAVRGTTRRPTLRPRHRSVLHSQPLEDYERTDRVVRHSQRTGLAGGVLDRHPALNSNGLLGMRMDCETSGGFTKSVLWRWSLQRESERATKLTAPTRVISVPSLNTPPRTSRGTRQHGGTARRPLCSRFRTPTLARPRR